MSTVDPLIAYLVVRRRQLGMSIGDVARAAGVSKASVSCWERGLKSPTLASLRGWSGALSVALEAEDDDE